MGPLQSRPRPTSAAVAEVDAVLAWAGDAAAPRLRAVSASDEVVAHGDRQVLRRAEHLRPVRPLPDGTTDLDPRSYARLLLLTTALPAIDVVAHVREHYPLTFADAVVVTCAALA